MKDDRTIRDQELEPICCAQAECTRKKIDDILQG